MESNKLNSNLDKLRQMIPLKPTTYTSDYPKTLGECLTKYLRQSTINNIRASSWSYDQGGWPLPIFVDPSNIQIGSLNKYIFLKYGLRSRNNKDIGLKYIESLKNLTLGEANPTQLKKRWWIRMYSSLYNINFQYYDWLYVPLLCNLFKITNIDDFVINLFETNFSFIKDKFLNNPILKEKIPIIESIIDTYEKKNWVACICTLFPLLDFLTRKYFNTTKLEKDLTVVSSVFKKAGYNQKEIYNLKPSAISDYLSYLLITQKITFEELQEKFKQNDDKKPKLGLIGIALSSFLSFGKVYYDYYRQDNKDKSSLNRHSIMHGANDEFYTKVNAVKLITYLYLMLELEPVLKIVFNEE